ncbi:YecA family protein [Amedibacillus sp. YH-ame6]
MKEEIINRIKDAHKENNIEKCFADLAWLMLTYNSEITESGKYNHGFKHILFKLNIIRNPLGMNYSDKEYRKTCKILHCLLELIENINNPNIDTLNIFSESLHIDDRLIKDIYGALIYTNLLYEMKKLNTKRLESNTTSHIPFIEQLLNILVFQQDQTRLVKQQLESKKGKGYITGMEFSITENPVDYFDGLKVSIMDSFESRMESINQIVRYLYYKNRGKFEDKIQNINYELIHPYNDVDFELYLNVAFQRYYLCRLEEDYRYGTLCFGGTGPSEDPYYFFSVENEEKYKARRIGVLRREYQFRRMAMINTYSQFQSFQGNKAVKEIASKLIKLQREESKIFDFNVLHIDVKKFKEAEKVVELKVNVVELLIKKFYLENSVNGIKIKDLISTYKYLFTISEVLYFAYESLVDKKDENTIIKEISVVDIEYFSDELSRLYNFKKDYAKKLINCFIFHEKDNKADDIFAQPLIKASKTQVVFCPFLIDQVNLDRFIERQFIRNEKSVSKVGKDFEKEFIGKLKRGHKKSSDDNTYKKIPNFKLNTNSVEYEAFDGKDIEFDVISVLGDYLILIELKAIMTSYDISDLDTREGNVEKAIKQLKRRAKSVKEDWIKFAEKVSIDLPEQPYDDDHIILIACSDAFDFTPNKKDGVFITDDSTYLKYFTSPYFDIIEQKMGCSIKKKSDSIWEKGYPNGEELQEYLMNPVSTRPFFGGLEKQTYPMPCFDEKDHHIYREDYVLVNDPIVEMAIHNNPNFIKVKERIHSNDPCPCGSGKKYKRCCRKNLK